MNRKEKLEEWEAGTSKCGCLRVLCEVDDDVLEGVDPRYSGVPIRSRGRRGRLPYLLKE